MKTVVILPGWEQNSTEDKYMNVGRAFTDAGFEVLMHDPVWALHETSKWVDGLLHELPPVPGGLSLVGFSMGAMISLLAATQLELDNLVLCSPSGYFKEYVPLLGADDLAWSQSNIKDYCSISAQDILARVKVRQGYVLAGDEELAQWPDFKQWVEDLHKATRWPVTVIPGAGHNIGAVNYQKALVNLISTLK